MTDDEMWLRREFAVAGWNGMMADLQRILKDHPDALGWDDDRNGMTALHGAAAQCQTEVINFLLKKGADINARDNEGRTPLMHAAANGGKTHLQALLDGGADITLCDKNGRDAIHYTSNIMRQPQNADIIRRHARLLELKQAQEEEAHKQADIESAAAQMRDGAICAVKVGKPLKLRL